MTWTFNSAPTEHSTTRTGSGFWDSGAQSSASYTRTFNNKGTFSYVCKIHPSMTGFVIVE